MKKPILVLDFDGVIHSYTSGWQGARNIPDAPVPGALEFIVKALEQFEVHILSSRSHHWGGRYAMKQWLGGWLRFHGDDFVAETPRWWMDYISAQHSMEPWDYEVRNAADLVIRTIKWPLFKPSAMVTIDDRALTFDGTWPSIASLKAFKPWNKRSAATP